MLKQGASYNASTLGNCHVMSHFFNAQLLPNKHVTKALRELKSVTLYLKSMTVMDN